MKLCKTGIDSATRVTKKKKGRKKGRRQLLQFSSIFPLLSFSFLHLGFWHTSTLTITSHIKSGSILLTHLPFFPYSSFLNISIFTSLMLVMIRSRGFERSTHLISTKPIHHRTNLKKKEPFPVYAVQRRLCVCFMTGISTPPPLIRFFLFFSFPFLYSRRHLLPFLSPILARKSRKRRRLF